MSYAMLAPKIAVAQAREACGCIGCQGGYGIGQSTLAMPAQARPTTCVASAVVTMLLTPIHMHFGAESAEAKSVTE